MGTTKDVYAEGRLRQRWDYDLLRYTEWDAAGSVTLSRPFTPEETAEAQTVQGAIVTLRQVTDAQVALERQIAVTVAPDELAALNTASLQVAGQVDGGPWRQPTGAHDAYPMPFTVSHNGTTWENLTPANVWEPGVSGWREVGDCPDFVQPTGAHDAYDVGDCVTFDGQRWTSLIPANVWSPTDYPAGWQREEG